MQYRLPTLRSLLLLSSLSLGACQEVTLGSGEQAAGGEQHTSDPSSAHASSANDSADSSAADSLAADADSHGADSYGADSYSAAVDTLRRLSFEPPAAELSEPDTSLAARELLAQLASRGQLRLQGSDATRQLSLHAGRFVARRADARALRVSFAPQLREPVVVQEPHSGMRVGFRLEGAQDSRARTSGDAAVYERAYQGESDVIVNLTARGVEDHIVFQQAPVVSEVRYPLSLTPEVAGLRLAGNSLEFLDAAGTPRLRVNPPTLIDDAGARHAVTLGVDGCDVDTSGRLPWGNSVVPPGSGQCVMVLTWSNAEVQFPAVLDPEWTPTGDLAGSGRDHHAAVLLEDGRVLIAGGYHSSGLPDELARIFATTSEVYDPDTATWASVSGPGSLVKRAPLMRLDDGRVFTIRQRAGAGDTATALFDPETGVWEDGPDAPGGAALPGYMTTTKLADGRLLLTGGMFGSDPPTVPGPVDPAPIPRAEAFIYDPTDDSISEVGSLGHARADHAASLLPDGRVWLTGGLVSEGNFTARTEHFDPATGTFSAGPSLGRGVRGHHQFTLSDGVWIVGSVIVFQGELVTQSIGESYDPDTATRTFRGFFQDKADFAAVEREGTLWVVGSDDAADSLVSLDKATAAELTNWERKAGLSEHRQGHTATVLADGSILITGGLHGNDGASYRTSYVYRIVADGEPCSDEAECGGVCLGGVCESLGICGDGECGPGEASCSCAEDCGVDSDGDGLSDDWELNGVPASVGGQFLDLPAMGADPLRKDIFLEIDYMVNGDDVRSPPQSWLDTSVDFFANAPVDNPDGSSGITLHVFVDEAVEFSDQVCLGYADAAAAGATALPDIMLEHFEPHRWAAFRYALLGNRRCDGNWLSEAVLSGNRMLLGSRDITISDPEWVQGKAYTIAHEMGHLLGLWHGGSEEVNYKPNYVSIMNYLYANGEATRSAETGMLTYSAEELSPLDESALSEAAGVGALDHDILYYCPDRTRVPSAASPVDWDCDGEIEADAVTADINNDGRSTTLTGWNDYANLRFDFQCTSDYFAFGEPTDIIVEPNPDEDPELEKQLRSVRIDIVPGCGQNPVDLSGALPLRVALFSEADFDATSIDTATAKLQTAAAQSWSSVDVDEDGLLDLVLSFDATEVLLNANSSFARLTADLDATLAVVGEDSVSVEATPDSDADGVADQCDVCPGTPSSPSPVDFTGCLDGQLPGCSFAPSFDCPAVALFARESVILHDRVSVAANAGAPALVVNAGTLTTRLENDVQTQDVWSKASVSLWHRVTVDGALRTNGQITYLHAPSVTISGDELTGQSLVLPNLSNVSVVFPTLSGNVTVQPDKQRTLAPGNHGTVQIGDRGTLTLSAGDYYLNSLQVGSNAKLAITGSGQVRIFVKTSLSYFGSNVLASGATLQLFYMGNSAVTVERDFDGTLVAPNAAITLATDTDAYTGAFFAKRLELRTDVRIRRP